MARKLKRKLKLNLQHSQLKTETKALGVRKFDKNNKARSSVHTKHLQKGKRIRYSKGIKSSVEAKRLAII